MSGLKGRAFTNRFACLIHFCLSSNIALFRLRLLVKSVSAWEGASRSFICGCSTRLPEEALTDFSGDSVSVRLHWGSTTDRFEHSGCTGCQLSWGANREAHPESLHNWGLFQNCSCCFLLCVPAGGSWQWPIKAKNNYGLTNKTNVTKSRLSLEHNLLNLKYFVAFSVTVNHEENFTLVLWKLKLRLLFL